MKKRTLKSKAAWQGMAVAIGTLAIAGVPAMVEAQALRVDVNADGSYSIAEPNQTSPVLTAGVAAEIEGHWVQASQYPHHAVQQSSAAGYLGQATEWQVTFSGLQGEPDLVYRLRAYAAEPFADLEVEVENKTGSAIHVEALRSVEATGGEIVNLGGPAAQDRVLSDSFSEDRPAMKIYDLAGKPNGLHLGAGSQLIYNRQSHESWFVGALSADRFLTILRLHVDKTAGGDARVAAYEVESTGTTEIEKAYSLREDGPADRVELSVEVPAGETLQSEPVLMGASSDYHAQLETYGSLIRQIHHARVSSPPLMGWWSWTAFYFGLNDAAAETNALWVGENLKPLGYNVFHIDEGYQYARGEYTTPNATLFPHGMASLEYKIRGLGLLPGIWTAPFEVSNRSWVYENHPDWLVTNEKGQPIQIGTVETDRLYVLDTTNPGAADYLRQTYSTMNKLWGIHYFKLDFMDDTAVEGHHYRPNTSALQAQRIGLGIIRDTVGDGVYLDKDGSPMLSPVGYVNYGRISQDTGHSFRATREAATGIAARYYMNRNFYISDPDAFSLSADIIGGQSSSDRAPLTLDQARASIALAAVSGGMLEIGDDLPTLDKSPERIALLKNQDVIDMIRLGRASVPVDLMDYAEKDVQPSEFLLNESKRQKMLTLFNWTADSDKRTVTLSKLGLADSAHTTAVDVFTGKSYRPNGDGAIQLELPPESAALIKLIDTGVAATEPAVTLSVPEGGDAGEPVALSAAWKDGDPVVAYHWNLDDGTTQDGREISHTWTGPGDYEVRLTAVGLSGKSATQSVHIKITGQMKTDFDPASNRRLR